MRFARRRRLATRPRRPAAIHDPLPRSRNGTRLVPSRRRPARRTAHAASAAATVRRDGLAASALLRRRRRRGVAPTARAPPPSVSTRPRPRTPGATRRRVATRRRPADFGALAHALRLRRGTGRASRVAAIGLDPDALLRPTARRDRSGGENAGGTIPLIRLLGGSSVPRVSRSFARDHTRGDAGLGASGSGAGVEIRRRR